MQRKAWSAFVPDSVCTFLNSKNSKTKTKQNKIPTLKSPVCLKEFNVGYPMTLQVQSSSLKTTSDTRGVAVLSSRKWFDISGSESSALSTCCKQKHRQQDTLLDS